MDGRASRPRTVPYRAASILDARPRDRVRRAADRAAPRHRRHDLQPAGRPWLSGRYRKRQKVTEPGSAARGQLFPGVYDATNPANAAKLDAADALGALGDEAGMTLIQMAIAFVTRHPAVTSAIIGPRTHEHLDTYLATDGIELSTDLLDRIDQIVPPGDTVNVADNLWNRNATALEAASRRR